MDITAKADGYIAHLNIGTGKVSIFVADGPWAGDGRWQGGRVVDCAANLGDEVWDDIDEAIADAIADAEGDA